MNANRMKYSTTPTYGLQKRGLLGKKTPAQPKTSDAPDFSQMPDGMTGMFGQPLYSTPTQQTGYPGVPAPYAGTAAAPWFPQGMSIPPMQSVPSTAPFSYPASSPMMPQQPMMGGMAQMPQGAGPFMPRAAAPANSAFTPMQNQLQGSQQSAGNGAQTAAPAAGFSPRNQGFVPPQPAQPAYQGGAQTAPFGQPPQPSAPGMQPTAFMGGSPVINSAMMGNSPMVSSAMMGNAPMAGVPMGGNTMQGSAMMGASPMAGGVMPTHGMGFTPENQSLFSNGGGQPAAPFQQAQGSPPTPRYSQQRAHTPLDVDKLWSIFLFGVLPLLFIPCIFVPQSLNFIRYLFLVLSVCGMGGMWYRQMFGSTTRLIISIVYVALCIVTVSMLMQGGRDIQQTSAGAPSAQATAQPDDGGAAAAAVTEAPTATPGPTTAGKSEAEMRLDTFMSNWAGNRVEDMVRLVQPSWATAQETPTNRLFMLLGNRTPTEYTIEEISGTDEDTSRTVTMTATIDKNNGKTPSVYRFMVLMVKEGGEWYVDPASLATNDEVQAEEANVVNDKTSTGAATAAPRTTVSPAPLASTVLYYNPDGGHYYHMDASCESIKEEYRPLQGSFMYSELKTYMNEKNLQPCLHCGAPTSTLDDTATDTATDTGA